MNEKIEFMKHPAYQYAIDVVEEKFPANEDIKMVCQNFLDDIDRNDSDDFKYWFDYKFVKVITGMCKLINMASGIKAGTPVHDSLAPFQWFFILNALCWKHRDDHQKRRYEQSVLLIARKSGNVLPPFTEM